VRGPTQVCTSNALDHVAYLAKLPEVEVLFGVIDFSLFLIAPQFLRYIAGFGRAHAVTADRYAGLLRDAA